MIGTFYDGDACALAPESYFKLTHGVRPSFGHFTMGASAAAAAIAAGTSGILSLDGVSLYNIFPIKSKTYSALSPATATITLADERSTWPFYYGGNDYNTYKADRTLSRAISGPETDYDLDNLNGASEWTFAEVFENIFETVLGLAAANYTISMQAVGGAVHARMPRNIRGKNIPAPEILHQVLTQANCYLAVDLLTNPPHYQVLPIGDEDTHQATITYRVGAITLKGGVRYRSLQNANLNKNPESETDWWILLYPHKLYELTLNTKTSRGASVKALAGKTFFVDDGIYETPGAGIAVTGGTGVNYLPSPYAAFYESGTIKNESFLDNMADELANEYKLSFQNGWYKLYCPGALAISLGRGTQEVVWELTPQQGYITRMRSFRPREEAFPTRHTLFALGKFWAGGGGSGGPQIAYCKENSPDDDEITCYLGVAVEEWSSVPTYDLDEWCEVSGTEYKSLQASNNNHAVTDGDWWEEGTVSVTVHCLIINGSSLMYAAPFLYDGDPILVDYVQIAGESVLTCTNIEFNGARFTS